MRSKHRKNLEPSSQDSQSYLYDHLQLSSQFSGSSQDSDSSRSLQKDISDAKLNKKDLLKLIKLEKAIEREESILARELSLKKSKSQMKSVEKKRIVKKQQKFPTPSASERILSEKKKLFITAIEPRYSEEEVDDELTKLLKNIQGLVNFRVKKKQGSSTYAFVDFVSKEKAAEALEKLKKKRIFGEKITICYSQDDQRQNNRVHQANNGTKKCFECNGKGHFAKECPLKRKLKKQPKDQNQNYFTVMKNSENTNFQQDDQDSEEEPVKYESGFVKLEPEEAPAIKRIIRKKEGLGRLSQI